MTLVRWMPRRDLVSMQHEINKMFNSFFGSEATDEVETNWTPRLDVVEDKDHYTVMIDIPGMRKDDVKITLRENVLNVRGERTEEVKRDGDTYHIIERRFGKFSRSLTLPTNVIATKIEAKMNDGVLVVTLPKAEDAKPREITISAE